jgi:hypothetical protein
MRDGNIKEIIVEVKFADGESYAVRKFANELDRFEYGGDLYEMFGDCEKLHGRGEK